MRNHDLSKRKLVRGVGLNDADYAVTEHAKEGGKRKIVWICPYYRTWASMFERCYSDKFAARCPTYKGCTVCNEWLTFSNFKAWMETQDWQGKQLDKDILIPGNKVYSPETCVFISGALNLFLTARAASRGAYAIGVSWERTRNMFLAFCRNPFTSKQEHLGYHASPEEAHEAWRQRKHELACQYADMQTDPRLAEALRARFAAATFSTSNEPKEVCNA